MPNKKPQTLKCSTRRIQAQNDLRDWEIDRLNKPVKVVNEKFWTLRSVSVDPRDIPKTKIVVAEGEDTGNKIKAATDIEADKRNKT